MPQQNSMPRFRPVIRVFVSSTFSDLKPERNALQAQVFPRLEQLCAQNGFQFQAIDLRWGVSSEAGLDHRTMRICFDELRRAQEISPRPNFLMLLGNRYGWRPLPEEISVAEFQALERAAAQVATTTDQPAAAVLQAWYRRDDNAVPPVYLLQSRRQQLPDAKDYTQAAPWNEIQAILWTIINRAQLREQLRGRFDAAAQAEGSPPAIVRFQASATEQEIWHGALRVPDAREHVLAFFRQIENVAEFSEPAQIENFVDIKRSENIEQIDKALWDEQERLKEALKSRLGEKNIFASCARLVPKLEAQDQPTADITTDHLVQLCADVEKRMTEIIQAQIEEYWNQTKQASAERAERELKIEQDEHERFGRERGGADSFVGREAELKAIRDYLQNDSPWPLVVHGASGCGKTALLARAVEQLKKAADNQPSTINHQPLLRFIGVTPRSSKIRSLLGSLCQELRLRHPREGELSADTKTLSEELQEHFQSATKEQPIILFLDALDQLSDADGGRLLNWIPYGQLPPHAKLVVSCLSDRTKDDPAGQPFVELTRRQLIAKNSINLDALSEKDASTLLFKNWLHQAGRKVSDQQRERIEQILKSKECRQPIYLKLLFEEARIWRSYDAAPKLGESMPAILGQLIDRLSQSTNHGRLLVERVLGYLAASRHGLAENEILEVLFADPDYKAALDRATEQTLQELPASATRIPIAIWSRLRFDLAPYLTERAAPGANVLTFYHRQVAEWVQEHFVKASEHSWQPHQRLADYFTACAKGTAKEWETDSVRGFAECVYQLIKAGQHAPAAGLLSNFPFLLHKLRVGLLEGVFEDYDLLRREAPAGVMKQLDIWADFFREKAHILRRGNEEWPTHKILLHLAVEHADDSPLAFAAERWLTEGRCDWLWLRRIPRMPRFQKNPCLAVLEGHTNGVEGALALSDGRLLSWSSDHTLRLWEGHNGACRAVLEGHESVVNGALALSDGQLLSWAWDKTLRLWSQDGDCLKILKGHRIKVDGALMLGEGRLLSWTRLDLLLWDLRSGANPRVVEADRDIINGVLPLNDSRFLSWSYDKTLRLWDSNTGDCLKVLEGHNHLIIGALALCDGRLLSWSCDETLRLWDPKSGNCLKVLEGHSHEVTGARALGDGRLISWSYDKTLRLWDSHTGNCLKVLNGHRDKIAGALILGDDRLISWSYDKTLRLWDSHTGDCLKVLEGHSKAVAGALILGDDRLLSWSYDKTLRLWESHNGTCLKVLEGHGGAIYGALELDDGRLLSWSGDTTLRLWNSQNGVSFKGLDRHGDLVVGTLALSCARLLSWSWDGTLRLWDIHSGVCLSIFTGNGGVIFGAKALSNGCLLSWAADNAMRLWDSQSGACLAVFQGHTGVIMGALVLADGRLLSWSFDQSLRLWDDHNGVCLAVLEGHTDYVNGALVLFDGRLLSWSRDCTLRLWDIHSGICLKVLEGHAKSIGGVLALSDGTLLSWSQDKTLRLWNGQTGACLNVFEGHRWEVNGALVLNDNTLLSWSTDNTLRVWDRLKGVCLKVLEGHSWSVNGAVVLTDGQLLSWSGDKTLRSWDVQSGKCLVVTPFDRIGQTHPDLLYGYSKSQNQNCTWGNYFIDSSGASASLRHKLIPQSLAVWNADSHINSDNLLLDGAAVISQHDGQVCILKLYHGNRRVSLAEVEEILASQKKTAK